MCDHLDYYPTRELLVSQARVDFMLNCLPVGYKIFFRSSITQSPGKNDINSVGLSQKYGCRLQKFIW